MATEVSIAEDNLSSHGLRRVHLVQGGKKPVDLDAAMQRALDDGARREDVCFLAWEDEDTGLQHLRLWWRSGMINYPFYGWTYKAGDAIACGQAILQAIKGYQQRNGKWPNRAAVREGQAAPPCVTIDGEAGRIGMVDVVYVDWISPGMVGVYREEEAAGGSVSE